MSSCTSMYAKQNTKELLMNVLGIHTRPGIFRHILLEIYTYLVWKNISHMENTYEGIAARYVGVVCVLIWMRRYVFRTMREIENENVLCLGQETWDGKLGMETSGRCFPMEDTATPRVGVTLIIIDFNLGYFASFMYGEKWTCQSNFSLVSFE